MERCVVCKFSLFIALAQGTAKLYRLTERNATVETYSVHNFAYNQAIHGMPDVTLWQSLSYYAVSLLVTGMLNTESDSLCTESCDDAHQSSNINCLCTSSCDDARRITKKLFSAHESCDGAAPKQSVDQQQRVLSKWLPCCRGS